MEEYDINIPKIKRRLKYYKDWQEDIIDNIKSANNINANRVINWGKEMENISQKIEELESLLYSP